MTHDLTAEQIMQLEVDRNAALMAQAESTHHHAEAITGVTERLASLLAASAALQPTVELTADGVDPVRARALDAAAVAAGPIGFDGPQAVVAAARTFEAYLREQGETAGVAADLDSAHRAVVEARAAVRSVRDALAAERSLPGGDPSVSNPDKTGTPDDLDLDHLAARIASTYGVEILLHFDPTQNYRLPDDAPWTAEVAGQSYGGYTAIEALRFAADQLAAKRS